MTHITSSSGLYVVEQFAERGSSTVAARIRDEKMLFCKGEGEKLILTTATKLTTIKQLLDCSGKNSYRNDNAV